MQVSVETTSGLGRRLTVGVPADTIDTAVDQKLKDAAKQVRIDGFRPGKVPLKEVRRRFGKSIREEVIGEVVSNSFYDAVTKESLSPAGYPSIERTKDQPGQDLEFVATFEVYPEVTVQGLDNISVVRPVAEINETDIDNMIERLREQRAAFEEVDRAAEQGDQVNINFLGTKDGEAFEGGTADGQNLVLGSGQMIPGFEDGIIGMSKGEEKVIDVTFPEDYHSEELKGQAVQFKITVNKVESKTLPEVNEEFIKNFTQKAETSMDEFRAEIRNNMERELKNAIKNRVKKEVMDGVLENNDVEVPKALIDSEIDRQRQQMMQQFGGGQNFDMNMLPAELFEGQATRAVKLALVLGELIKEKEVKADAERVRSTIEEMAQPYENPEQVVSWYYENQQMLQQVEAMVLEDQVVDLILEQATVAEQEMSYEEAVKQPQNEAE
ncbi:MAG: trigger factor [Pseudomonadales bacterium]|jgi:trigger factor|nr:trigger factor [Pseudomonadales bacterium]MEC8811043.1 trigger factor [Pseudomonadota bacterium]TNC88791.1 MAG: trigger factor [Alcanivorax sp.]HAU15136.1 trigger factor [Gammaproteobacteria bacterium]MBI28161.1 trigger factor [Pseudomonadales bacterium]|tara:strand:- start:19723 stop:21039 length:1317 start_codon:yes stop_codon:yes gene_type:complete